MGLYALAQQTVGFNRQDSLFRWTVCKTRRPISAGPKSHLPEYNGQPGQELGHLACHRLINHKGCKRVESNQNFKYLNSAHLLFIEALLKLGSS